MNRHQLRTIAAGLLACLAITGANAAQEYWVPIIQQSESTHTTTAPAGRENWYGFSPDGLAAVAGFEQHFQSRLATCQPL